MKFVKGLLVVGALAGMASFVVPQAQVVAQDRAPRQLSEDQLGEVFKAMGLDVEKKQQRFDFAFRTVLAKEEWELTMSSVLSQDGSDVWVMAWLDELPKNAAEVPKTALLRLLAQNDQLGSGKFFAYVPANRRFVLQRTIPNEDLTSAKMRVVLEDLGASVVNTYPIWATANWNPTGIPAAPTGSVPAPTQSATKQFQQPIAK